MRVKDKVFVVTGAGSGIGRQLALELLRRGAHVAALDVNPKTLEETTSFAAQRARRLSTAAGDIADRATVESLPAAVVRAHGSVDGMGSDSKVLDFLYRLAPEWTAAFVARQMRDIIP